MKRLKCEIAYDGTNFNGFQIQPRGRTIQGEIEEALKKIHKGRDIKIYGSGRTDATVHAKGQVFHFDTNLEIPIKRWTRAIQTLCPEDIIIIQVTEVSSDFHARYNVVSKEYRYYVQKEVVKDVFRRLYSYHYPYYCSVEKMTKGADFLIGEHNFTSFCSAKTKIENKIRKIYSIDIIEHDNEIEFRFVGNGFLYNMVRILVGTLLEVGQSKKEPEDIKAILEGEDRDLAGHTAPGHGLFLWKVNYNN